VIVPATFSVTFEHRKTPRMEVHHHPDLHHKSKPWKEYLLEFLMIFLAVTLGFFAETFREKLSEKHREREYIIGLINNIASDTTELTGLISRNDRELLAIDSLMLVQRNHFTELPQQDSLYYYMLGHTISLHLFEFNDLTVVQLRNAGGYSVIKTDKVADSIARYELSNNDIRLQEKFVTDAYTQTWNSFKQVFDGTQTKAFSDQFAATGRIPGNIPVLISTDKEKLHVLFNNYWTFAIILKGYRYLLNNHQLYLKRFSEFLKKTYEIE
jgi:hypothetical protein